MMGRSKTTDRRHMLHHSVRFALFATSYLPLFVLIILRQLTDNAPKLRWGGFHADAVTLFLRSYGISLVLTAVGAMGAVMLWVSLRNIRRSALTNGVPVQITEVRNRNAESISYIGTYIIPFLFEDYSSLYAVLAVVILLGVIYFIYVNSTLLLINPVLNLWYSLYEVEFSDAAVMSSLPVKAKTGMIIAAQKFLEEDDRMLFQRLGPKLYFAEEDASRPGT